VNPGFSWRAGPFTIRKQFLDDLADHLLTRSRDAEYVATTITACTSMTIRMYANFKKLPLDEFTVTLSHDRQHVTDCEGCDEAPRKVEVIDRVLHSDLTIRTRLG